MSFDRRIIVALREKVTESISKYSVIPEEKADKKRRFYYKNYEDNLYCPLGDAALKAYEEGSGAETFACNLQLYFFCHEECC